MVSVGPTVTERASWRMSARVGGQGSARVGDPRIDETAQVDVVCPVHYLAGVPTD